MPKADIDLVNCTAQAIATALFAGPDAVPAFMVFEGLCLIERASAGEREDDDEKGDQEDNHDEDDDDEDGDDGE